MNSIYTAGTLFLAAVFLVNRNANEKMGAMVLKIEPWSLNLSWVAILFLSMSQYRTILLVTGSFSCLLFSQAGMPGGSIFFLF